MSMAALRWIRPLSVSPTQKVVLWALADQANDDGEAWPSIAGLMEATCLSERAIRGALRELEGAGFIETEAGGGRNRTSCYRLAMSENGAARAEKGQEPPRNARHEKGHLLPERGQQVPKRGHVVPKKGQQVPPNPQYPQEPSGTLNTRARSAQLPIPVALPLWLPAEAWDAWCQHRVAKDRKGWTHAAAIRCVAQLEKFRAEGDDPVAVIDQAIAGGWTGLFPLKNRSRSPPREQSKLAWMTQPQALEPL